MHGSVVKWIEQIRPTSGGTSGLQASPGSCRALSRRTRSRGRRSCPATDGLMHGSRNQLLLAGFPLLLGKCLHFQRECKEVDEAFGVSLIVDLVTFECGEILTVERVW
jgi:hypothetical protein